MPVLYGEYEFRPVQSVDFSRPTQALGDGRVVNSVVRAVVKGTIVPDVTGGVPTPVDSDSKMSAILARQKEIREALSVQGKVFEVRGWDGAAPARFQARVVDVDFGPDILFNKNEYTITLESAEFSGEASGNYHVESADESWSFEEDEFPLTTKVTHTVRAKGQLVYDATGGLPKLPWEYAKDFVTGQLGLGWQALAGSAFSPKSGQQLAALSARQVPSTTAWNRTLNEEVNEAEGSYSATESFLLAAGDHFEEHSVGVKRVDDQPNLIVVATLQGKVHGFYTDLNDYATRYANALAAWGTVAGQLKARADAACGVTLNDHPSAYQVDHDEVAGVISYQLEFNNRVLTADTWETYSVAKKRALEDYKTTVTVEGTVYGVTYLDTDSDPAVRLTRARNRWETVKGLVFSRAVAASGLNDLKPYPVDAQVTDNTGEGTVTYSYSFDNRPNAQARFEYQVGRRYSRDEARVVVTVEGTVTGLVTTENADPFAADAANVRYQNALAYWNATEPNLYGLAAGFVGSDGLWPEPWSKSVSHDPWGGKVSFTYEFNSQRRCFPFALSEVLSVTDEDAVPVVAEIPIPGRAAGPIVQDMDTVTASYRTFQVELVMPLPKACGYQPPPEVDVTPYQPSGRVVRKQQDVKNWSWNTGRYSRTVKWLVTG